MTATCRHVRPGDPPRSARRGMSILLVLALVSMTLALSYAMLRTQATVEQSERNTHHRSTARLAARTGMSVALRAISEPTWRGVDVGMSGRVGDGSTYAVRFETGDAALGPNDPDYAEYPYRMTIISTGSVVDPANPQIQATHQIRSVVQLVRRKLADAPSEWSATEPYTLYQWATGGGREVDIETPCHIEGPVYLQNRINYLTDYPGDGDDKPFDGVIDEVAILQSALSASNIKAIYDDKNTLKSFINQPSSQAVAWWRFEDASDAATAVDELGNHDGRYEGSRAAGAPGPVRGGNGSAQFDGYDDHVDLGAIDVDGSAMTIVAWINADDFDVADARIISKAKGASESDTYWAIGTYRILGFNLLWFRLKTDSGDTDTLYAFAGPLASNTWSFVTAVYDGTSMQLYKDGELIAQRFKSGTIRTDPTARVSIGNSPSGSPRARLLRDYEAMRTAGQGDARPFSGPVDAPLSLTPDHERRLLEHDSNVALYDVAVAGGTAPVTRPGDVSSYQLYPGGKMYRATQLDVSIASADFAPDPKSNPLGLVTRPSQLVVYDDVTIRGTVLVSDSSGSGRIELRGTGVEIAGVSLPLIYGDSTVYQLPSVIAGDDVEVYDGSRSRLDGMIFAWDDLQCFQGGQATEMRITGRVVVGELEIEARSEWDRSSHWWALRHAEFLGQLGDSSASLYFPQWLKENHGLDAQPKLTLQPASDGVRYHWHDWSKPLFEAHPDDGGLRWDLLVWQENP